MKQLCLLIGYLCVFWGCASSNSKPVIGKTVDNQIYLSQDLESVKNQWNILLNEHVIKGRITHFAIKKNRDTNEIAKEYFALIGYSKDSTPTIATELVLRNSKFYFRDYKEQRIVICHGATDCIPQKFKNDSWGCDCQEAHLFDCKKTEVIIERK